MFLCQPLLDVLIARGIEDVDCLIEFRGKRRILRDFRATNAVA